MAKKRDHRTLMLGTESSAQIGDPSDRSFPAATLLNSLAEETLVVAPSLAAGRLAVRCGAVGIAPAGGMDTSTGSLDQSQVCLVCVCECVCE